MPQYMSQLSSPKKKSAFAKLTIFPCWRKVATYPNWCSPSSAYSPFQKPHRTQPFPCTQYSDAHELCDCTDGKSLSPRWEMSFYGPMTFTVQKVDENGAISWNNQGDYLLGRDSMKHFPVNSKRDLEKSLLTAAWRCDWTSGAPHKCFPNARLNMEDHEVPLCTSQSWKGNNGKTRQALNLLFGICKVHLQGWRSKILKNQNNFAGKHLESIFIERQELDFFPQLRYVASSGHGAIICCLHTDSSTAITHSRL